MNKPSNGTTECKDETKPCEVTITFLDSKLLRFEGKDQFGAFTVTAEREGKTSFGGFYTDSFKKKVRIEGEIAFYKDGSGVVRMSAKMCYWGKRVVYEVRFDDPAHYFKCDEFGFGK